MKNLIGQKFGYLLVEKRVENIKGRVAWDCKCNCGNQAIVTTRNLLSGKIKSCGCYKKEHSNYIKLENKTFNYIKVLNKTKERDYKGSIMWECQCLNCQRIFKLSEDALVHGSYKSCGCKKKELASKLSQSLHLYNGTCLEFIEKRKYRKDNKTGVVGVFETQNGSYKSMIGFMGKRYYLGTYKQKEEAVLVRRDAERCLHETFVLKYREWLDSRKDENKFHFEVIYENKMFTIKIPD